LSEPPLSHNNRTKLDRQAEVQNLVIAYRCAPPDNICRLFGPAASMGRLPLGGGARLVLNRDDTVRRE
jgi:hypothetical protein